MINGDVDFSFYDKSLGNALKRRDVHMPLVSERPQAQQQAPGHQMQWSCPADS